MIDELIKWGIIIAIIGAAGLWIREEWESKIADPLRAEGAAEQHAIDEPIATGYLARATSAEGAVAKQTKAASDKAQADAQAQLRTATTIATLAKTAAARKAEIDKLIGIASGPPAPETCENELADTNAILDGILAGRVRD